MDNADRRAFADALYAAGREHDARHEDRLARWRNVEPETAALLSVLVRSKPQPRVLEIGTSNGYSTIWLADAAEATGGRVVTLEIEPARTAVARENLAQAGLEERVDLRTEDAGQVEDFTRLVERDARVTSALVPIGAGVLLVAGPGSRAARAPSPPA